MSRNVSIVVLSTTTLANAATIYSNTYPAESTTGFSACLIVLSGSSNVTVTQESSIDGMTFYAPVTSAGSALGAVATALTASAGVYVQFSPVIARFNRLKVVAGAASTVAMSMVISE